MFAFGTLCVFIGNILFSTWYRPQLNIKENHIEAANELNFNLLINKFVNTKSGDQQKQQVNVPVVIIKSGTESVSNNENELQSQTIQTTNKAIVTQDKKTKVLNELREIMKQKEELEKAETIPTTTQTKDAPVTQPKIEDKKTDSVKTESDTNTENKAKQQISITINQNNNNNKVNSDKPASQPNGNKSNPAPAGSQKTNTNTLAKPNLVKPTDVKLIPYFKTKKPGEVYLRELLDKYLALPELKEYRCTYHQTQGKYCVKVYPHYFSPEIATRVKNGFEPRKSVQIITQMSQNRIMRLVDLVDREWNSTISLAFYSTNLKQDITLLLQYLPIDTLRNRVFIHFVVPGSPGPYPINLLRNLSLKYASEEMLFLLDLDFIPMYNLHAKLLEERELWDFLDPNRSSSKRVYIVPAFEYDDLAIDASMVNRICSFNSIIKCMYTDRKSFSPIPRTKQDLIAFGKKFKEMNHNPRWSKKFYRNEAIIPFHSKMQLNSHLGHHPTNFAKWYNITENYTIKYPKQNIKFEPYVVMRKSHVREITGPTYEWCDERFFDRGKNKIICLQWFDAYKFQFRVLHYAFIMHFYENRKQFAKSKKDLMMNTYEFFPQRSKIMFQKAQQYFDRVSFTPANGAPQEQIESDLPTI
jgi:hypothetical protein